MTIKEITALRKSGQLAEAMAAAEAEFAQAANRYTAGALFWCLNDLLKQQSGNEAISTIEQMRNLCELFGSDDNYMQTAMGAAEKRIIPHYYEVKNAIENAKNGGNAISLHNQIYVFYKTNDLSKQLYDDFGWLTYYALKQTNVTDVLNMKKLLHLYLQLDLPKPSILHSLILGEAVKVEKNTPLQ
ncbi:MAG: hypothetical protein ACI4AM_05705, partial [Muribaculaceae bacterium]